jgi:hypothetical protein
LRETIDAKFIYKIHLEQALFPFKPLCAHYLQSLQKSANKGRKKVVAKFQRVSMNAELYDDLIKNH